MHNLYKRGEGPMSKPTLDPEKDAPWNKPLRPLSSLPVVQDKYCSQKMTDDAIQFVADKRPELIKTLVEIAFTTSESFEEILDEIIDYLDEAAARGELQMPETYLGRIDLMFEISRRFELAYNWGRASYLPPTPDNPKSEKVFLKPTLWCAASRSPENPTTPFRRW